MVQCNIKLFEFNIDVIYFVQTYMFNLSSNELESCNQVSGTYFLAMNAFIAGKYVSFQNIPVSGV
jgi:hypothetical protein